MAVSDALLPSFSTFASSPAGREKTLRPAGAPNNVSVAPSRAELPVGFRGEDGNGRSPRVIRTTGTGRSGHRTGSAAFPDGFRALGLALCACGLDAAEPPGAHTGSAHVPYRAGGKAGAREVVVSRDTGWAGERARRVGVPVARAYRESLLGAPIPGTAGASPGSGGGGTQAGEPQRSLTRNRADTKQPPYRRRLNSDPCGPRVQRWHRRPRALPCLSACPVPMPGQCRRAGPASLSDGSRRPPLTSLSCPVPAALAGGALPHEATSPSTSRPPLRPGRGDRGHRPGEWRSWCGLQPSAPTSERDGGVQRSPRPGLYPLQLAVPSGVGGRHRVLIGISLILILPVEQRPCQCALHLQLQLSDPGRG